MKKVIGLPLIMGLVMLLAACGTAPAVEATTTENVTSQGNEPMSTGMGMGGNMMARHHATIPEAYAGLSNPVPADEASLARGAEIFAAHCATCHGDGGMGDGPTADSLDPAPAAIAHTSQMLGDDYQIWRISEGGAMEPFNSSMIAWKTILDEPSRWDVINYIQALGRGEVTPGQQMGGAAIDPAVQAANQAQMLANGIEQGVITEEEAAVFAAAHEKVDGLMVQMRADGASGSMDDMMADILAVLVSSGELTQEQADIFLSVHDRLGEAGLMQ